VGELIHQHCQGEAHLMMIVMMSIYHI